MGAHELSPHRRRARRARLHSLLLVLPAVLIAGVVVLGGMGMALVQSLGLLPLVGEARLSADAFRSVGPDAWRAVGVSLGIASVSTVLSTIIGFSAAIVIAQGRWTGRLVAALGAATIPVPHLIGAAAIGLLVADAGFLPRVLGVPGADWPELVGGPWWVAVILEYTWKESAFIALVVAGVLATRVARYDETAALLGASRARRLRHVVLPLARPALIVCGVIIFVYTLGSYEVAWLLGRPFPEPLPVLAYRLFTAVSLTARPEAAAVAVITSLIALIVVAIGMLALRRTPLWR